MRALGALPLAIASSEVYQARQTGVVDGTENPPSNLYTQTMHEVRKHVTVSNHGYLGYAVIVNKKFREGLPADIRAQLESAMRDATQYTNDIAKQENDGALKAVRKSGKSQAYTLTANEKRAVVPRGRGDLPTSRDRRRGAAQGGTNRRYPSRPRACRYGDTGAADD